MNKNVNLFFLDLHRYCKISGVVLRLERSHFNKVMPHGITETVNKVTPFTQPDFCVFQGSFTFHLVLRHPGMMGTIL